MAFFLNGSQLAPSVVVKNKSPKSILASNLQNVNKKSVRNKGSPETTRTN